MFAQFPDLHILLSPLPKSREDADVLYGQDDDANDARVQYCTIFEVLKDETPNLGSQGEKKFGWREQRWAALEVSKDGLGLVSAFQDTGTMRGMGLSRAYGKRKMEESETGVGTVAKIYGFGGRRV